MAVLHFLRALVHHLSVQEAVPIHRTRPISTLKTSPLPLRIIPPVLKQGILLLQASQPPPKFQVHTTNCGAYPIQRMTVAQDPFTPLCPILRQLPSMIQWNVTRRGGQKKLSSGLNRHQHAQARVQSDSYTFIQCSERVLPSSWVAMGQTLTHNVLR